MLREISLKMPLAGLKLIEVYRLLEQSGDEEAAVYVLRALNVLEPKVPVPDSIQAKFQKYGIPFTPIEE